MKIHQIFIWATKIKRETCIVTIKIKTTTRPRPIEDQGRKDVLIGISIDRNAD